MNTPGDKQRQNLIADLRGRFLMREGELWEDVGDALIAYSTDNEKARWIPVTQGEFEVLASSSCAASDAVYVCRRPGCHAILPAPRQSDADTILENAAKICDHFATGQSDVSAEFAMGIEHGARKCANAIRNLITSPVPESAPTRDYCESCGYTDSHDPNCPRPKDDAPASAITPSIPNWNGKIPADPAKAMGKLFSKVDAEDMDTLNWLFASVRQTATESAPSSITEGKSFGPVARFNSGGNRCDNGEWVRYSAYTALESILSSSAATFDQVRDAIASRMMGHTHPAQWAEAWTTFFGLLRCVKASECAITEAPVSSSAETNGGWNEALDAALACYSPDDTATDWEDKIRALKRQSNSPERS